MAIYMLFKANDLGRRPKAGALILAAPPMTRSVGPNSAVLPDAIFDSLGGCSGLSAGMPRLTARSIPQPRIGASSLKENVLIGPGRCYLFTF